MQRPCQALKPPPRVHLERRWLLKDIRHRRRRCFRASCHLFHGGTGCRDGIGRKRISRRKSSRLSAGSTEDRGSAEPCGDTGDRGRRHGCRQEFAGRLRGPLVRDRDGRLRSCGGQPVLIGSDGHHRPVGNSRPKRPCGPRLEHTQELIEAHQRQTDADRDDASRQRDDSADGHCCAAFRHDDVKAEQQRYCSAQHEQDSASNHEQRHVMNSENRRSEAPTTQMKSQFALSSESPRPVAEGRSASYVEDAGRSRRASASPSNAEPSTGRPTHDIFAPRSPLRP